MEASSMKNTQYNKTGQDFFVEEAIKNGEGVIASNGALSVTTGARTGRSPKDRYIVDDSITRQTVEWGTVNQPISSEKFEKLWQQALESLQSHPVYDSHLFVGADPAYRVGVKVKTNLAWHTLFCRDLFIESEEPLRSGQPEWQMICPAYYAPNPEEGLVSGTAAVVLDFTNHRILVCGTLYAGEMKKAMFSVLNYILPDYDVLPMHCAANKGKEGDVALFFGLSGTGKTTLSADPDRFLIGDDEHGWGPKGVFNFEGGCYAKCIRLSQKNEPMIWNALRHGAVMENVVLNPLTKVPDFDDAGLTENTRAAYPLDFIEGVVQENVSPHPQNVIFLTCDLFGVLPPVAKLNSLQAVYYFLSGYTALVGSTEFGSTEGIKPTFSRCFGAPFFPRPAQVYADLLVKRLNETKADVYLVNTGWTGGAYGRGGQRFSIPTTRRVVSAILSGELKKTSFEQVPNFFFEIPTVIEGVDAKQLDPRKSYPNQDDYFQNASQLIEEFSKNIAKFQVSDDILRSGPSLG